MFLAKVFQFAETDAVFARTSSAHSQCAANHIVRKLIHFFELVRISFPKHAKNVEATVSHVSDRGGKAYP